MKNKCRCYHTQKKLRYTYNPITGSPIPHDIEVGVCWGTKETDECNCGGDETQCDFYPKVRERALNEQKNNRTENSDDCLMVTYDCCHSDVPTLCIAREERDRVRVLNTIQGEQAFGMYYYLTGNAELKEKEIETNADKIRLMSDEELAEFLKNLDIDGVCHEGICLDGETCAGCMLKWLKKPPIREQ